MRVFDQRSLSASGIRRHALRRLTVVLCLLACGMAAAADPPPVRFTVERFVVDGDNPLSDRMTHMALVPFLGGHEGLEGLEAAAGALENTLKAQGYAFHRVVIVPQTLIDGVVTLRILAFRLGHVSVEGARRFSEENIKASLPALESGQPVNTVRIARGLQVANAHPAKQVAVYIRQGRKPETVDATVKVGDRRPYRLFSSLANTGNDETGDTRVSLGFQHSNLFDRDHDLTLSYTTSPEFVRDVTQLGVHYRVPIYPLAAGLSAFYSYSEVDQGQVADFFDISGKGRFGGLDADVTFMPIKTYSHKLNVGIQDRLFENESAFEETTIGLDVRSRPFYLRYTGRVEKARWVGSFYLEGAVNTATGAGNAAATYDAARPGAETDWTVLRYGADLDMVLPKRWRLRGRLSGQQATQPLIPGEQFGLGGARSVRGFDEREVSGESGQMVSAEVWTPAIRQSLHLVGFLDLGWSQLEKPYPAGTGDEFISGTGLGFRWFWKEYLSLVVDAAYVLDGARDTASGDAKIHFNIFLRY